MYSKVPVIFLYNKLIKHIFQINKALTEKKLFYMIYTTNLKHNNVKLKTLRVKGKSSFFTLICMFIYIIV